jgi:hypothetical protein
MQVCRVQVLIVLQIVPAEIRLQSRAQPVTAPHRTTLDNISNSENDNDGDNNTDTDDDDDDDEFILLSHPPPTQLSSSSSSKFQTLAPGSGSIFSIGVT